MRPRSPNRIGHEVLTSHMETCWSRGFRVNETLRRKFTCVAAYFFVRQDSRTSVALCTACPPNRMSISLRFSSFQLIVHAELCLAYLHHSYTTIGVRPSPTSSEFISNDGTPTDDRSVLPVGGESAGIPIVRCELSMISLSTCIP